VAFALAFLDLTSPYASEASVRVACFALHGAFPDPDWLREHAEPSARRCVAVNRALVETLKPTVHYDGVVQAHAAQAVAQQAREMALGDFRMPRHMVDLLTELGVPASELGSQEHSHPAHKTLERYVYGTAFPRLIPERRVAVLQTKPHKMRWLPATWVGPYNCTLQDRDRSRWAAPTPLPASLDVDAILVWDCAQFLGPAEVALLHQRFPNVPRIYWGGVFPAEARDGYASLYPDLYSIDYDGPNLRYHMEGKAHGAYEQPRDATWWLSCRRVLAHTPAGSLTVHLAPLESYFAHPLLVSDVRAPASPLGNYPLHPPSLMRIPDPYLPGLYPPVLQGEQVVSRALYHSVLDYYQSLNHSKRSPLDLDVKLRNIKQAPQHRHIRPDTWALLRRSVLACSGVQAEPLGSSEFEPGFLAWLARALTRALVSLPPASVSGAATFLAGALAKHYMPFVAGAAGLILQAARVTQCRDWHDVAVTFAQIGVAAALASVPLPATLACAAALWGGRQLILWRNRLQVKLHTEIHCATFELVFRPDSLVTTTACSPLYVWGGPSGTCPPPGRNDGGGPPTGSAPPAGGPPRPRLSLTRLAGFGGCRHCGRDRCPGGCVVCPIHQLELIGWRPGDEPECCAADSYRLFSAHSLSQGADEPAAHLAFAEGVPGHRTERNPFAAHVDTAPPSPQAPPLNHPDLPDPAVFVLGSDSSGSSSRTSPPPSVADEDAASVPDAPPDAGAPVDGPANLGITDTSAPHITCPCPAHAGSIDVPGANWVTCPAGHGIWSADWVSHCHLCDDVDPTIAAHACDCPAHTLRVGHAQLCARGFPHDGPAGAECHACTQPAPPPGVLPTAPLTAPRPAHFIHEVLGVDPELVANPWHPALRFESVQCHPSPQQRTCAVDAIAEAFGVDTAAVWATLATHCPHEALGERLPAPGLDERAFHVYHVVAGRRAVLQHDSHSAPRVVGRKTGPALLYRLENAHWTFAGHETPRAPPQLNRLAPSRLLNEFLDALDRYVSPTGARPLGTWQPYDTQPALAKTYLRELKLGVTGTILANRAQYPRDFLERVDASLDLARPRRVDVRAVTGFGGCGKSAPFTAFLRAHPAFAQGMTWMTAMPRTSLMQDWRAKVPLARFNWLHSTFEKALMRQARVLIVDEAPLLPPGYLELFLAWRPGISHVILLGDPTQCTYHNPSEESALNSEEPEWRRLFIGGVPYCHWTHRLPQEIARRLGTDTTSPDEGRVVVVHRPSRHHPISVFTESDQKLYSRLGFDARTISVRQGGEMHTLQIAVTKTALTLVSPGTWMSALTRVTHTLILVISVNPNDLGRVALPPALASVLGRAPPLDFPTAYAQELRGCTLVRLPPDELARIRAARLPTRAAGMGPPLWQERITYALQPLMDLGSEPLPPPLPAVEGPDAPEKARTHMPRADPRGLAEAVTRDLKPRELRELHDGHGMSELFVERPGDELSTASWFPHQKANDTTLFWATVHKRLTRGSPEANWRDLAAKSAQADLLFDALIDFCSLPGGPQPFDPQLFASCVIENDFVKLTKKTQRTLLNNVKRADPLWKLNLTEHFVKSQLKAKAEVLGADGKAGQTLALCQDAVVLLFGPIVRYCRRQVFGRAPPNRYFHCGRSLDDLGRWARAHWPAAHDMEATTTNDFSAFDSTQQGDSVGLEWRVMRHFGLDEAWLQLFETYRGACATLPELYVQWKMTVESDLIGPKEVGRDTGEPGTYDFNCWFNAAVSHLKYAVPSGVAACIGGDDSAFAARLTPQPSWTRVGPQFAIVARTEHNARAEFCGYFLSNHGAYRNARLLALKTLWHIAKGDSEAVDVNYAAEAATCYALGDTLHDIASWDELESLGWLLEYYHQERPALARHFFSSNPAPKAVIPSWLLEGRASAAARRRIAAELVAASPNTSLKGLSQAIFNYYSAPTHNDPDPTLNATTLHRVPTLY